MTSGYAAPIGFGATANRRPPIDRVGLQLQVASSLRLRRLLAIAIALGLSSMLTAALADGGGQSQQRPPPHRWTSFVAVDGQPEPVPAEWVATPEGRFAHSLKIPNPVPKDSGYRWWMSSKDYFKHLCDTEAGEFIYEKVENVEGFLFMRPPGRPSDSQLMDKRALEAPGFEAPYSIRRDSIGERGTVFVSPSEGLFGYIEEPGPGQKGDGPVFLFATGDSSLGIELKDVRGESESQSDYALTWRGVIRRADRDHRVAGFEVLIFNRRTSRILGVWRSYVMTAGGVLHRDQVAWLNAAYCPAIQDRYRFPERRALLGFVTRVLSPRPAATRGQR